MLDNFFYDSYFFMEGGRRERNAKKKIRWSRHYDLPKIQVREGAASALDFRRSFCSLRFPFPPTLKRYISILWVRSRLFEETKQLDLEGEVFVMKIKTPEGVFELWGEVSRLSHSFWCVSYKSDELVLLRKIEGVFPFVVKFILSLSLPFFPGWFFPIPFWA